MPNKLPADRGGRRRCVCFGPAPLVEQQQPTFLWRSVFLKLYLGLLAVGVAPSSLDAQEPAPPSGSAPADPADRNDGATGKLDGPGKEYRQAYERAVAHYQHAVELNPEDASNYVGLADSQLMLWCFGFLSGSEVLPSATEAAAKAVELDDRLAAAHTTLGVLQVGRWDWTAAERELQRGIELDPSSAKARHWYALYLAAMARPDEALKQSEQAMLLEPSPGYRTGLGAILYFRRDFDRMARLMERTVSLNPDFAVGYDWLGMAYVQLGRFDDSLSVYRKADTLSGGLAEIKAGLGHAYAVAGDEAEARRVLADLNRLSRKWHIPPVQVAFVHVGLGEKDEAFQWLEKAFQEKSWELVFLQVEPWLDELRPDPRFADLSRRMGFPP